MEGGGGGGNEPSKTPKEIMAKLPLHNLTTSLSKAKANLNNSISNSKLGQYFNLSHRGTSFTQELRAGTTTFLTMAYVISVNAAILSDSGATCNSDNINDQELYRECLSGIKKDLIIATSLVAMAGCFFMGAVANLPLALAPAMGANAYFAYNMVGFHGSGPLSYETALAVVMLEGCVFLLLSALGLRAKLARIIPRPIRLASAAGIGLFLAFTGLQAHQGIGLVGPSQSTLVTLQDGAMQSATFWLGAIGFVVTATCLSKNIKGSMIYGIAFVTLISWFRHTRVTLFPGTPEGNLRYEYFKKVVDFHIIKSTAGKFSFDHFFTRKIWLHLVTLLYVDVLNTSGSMYSIAEYGGFTDDMGRFKGEYKAFIVDASTTIVSAALGTTIVTTYLESTAGLREGGRTGLTAITVSFYFMLSLFFTPLFTSVPPWAVGPSLILVGVMMMKLAKEIEWGDMKEAVPSLLTMILMPLTFSISNGIIAGIGVYVAMNAWDYVVSGVKWMRTARKMMRDARNQVSAGGGGATEEISSAIV